MHAHGSENSAYMLPHPVYNVALVNNCPMMVAFWVFYWEAACHLDESGSQYCWDASIDRLLNILYLQSIWRAMLQVSAELC